MKTMTASLLLLAILAACSGGEEDGGNNSAEPAGQVVEQTPANLQDDPTNSVVPLAPTPAPEPSASPSAALPPTFRGRWGLGDRDCDPALDYAAKGLMVVSADTLTFYEARGRLRGARQVRPDAIRLDLAFTGEGQAWSRPQTLMLTDGGRTLVREEEEVQGQEPAGTFRYARCPANGKKAA